MNMNKAYLRLVDVDGGLRLVEGCVLYPPQQGPEIVDVDAAKLPEGFWEDWWGGKWAYADGAVVLSGIMKPDPPPAPMDVVSIIDAMLPAVRTQAAGTYDDAQLLQSAVLFVGQDWAAGVEYAAKEVLFYEGRMYQVEQAHLSQAHLPPDGEGMLAIYRPVRDAAEGEVLPWMYGEVVEIGDRREYGGVVYEAYAAVGANIWTPDTVPAIWRVVVS